MAGSWNPSVRLPLAHFFGLSGNQYHVKRGGRPYGAWVDGPMNPYRQGGDTCFQLAHSENYRIRVPDHNWGDRRAWRLEPDSTESAFHSPRTATESEYNNRHWIFSVWATHDKLYGLTHHEWYPNRVTAGGVEGFNGGGWWIAGIGWVVSRNGGASWKLSNPRTSSKSRRLVLVPEPSDWAGPTPEIPANAGFYGFAHPSNIVREAGLYYFFASSVNRAIDGEPPTRGVVLMRSTDIARPTRWSFWNGSGWTLVNHNWYQGNGGQRPYLFWSQARHGGELMAQNVRRHVRSGKWVVVGSNHRSDRPITVSTTMSLRNPVGLEPSTRVVPVPREKPIEADHESALHYVSLFDVTGRWRKDLNYQYIQDEALLVITYNKVRFEHEFLQLSGI